MNPIEVFRAGVAGIEADPALKEQAAKTLGVWLSHTDYAAYLPQIRWQIALGRWSDLLDQFYQVLPFGTGGRRGAVGIGPNRMNLWTLGASVQGHCEYLRQMFPGKELHVVLAYDVRKFLDGRKVYNPELPNPVLGLSSKDFCKHAAGVYVANGIRVHMPPPDGPRYYATPELSYAIRQLGAHGGLNVSASHNPPDDNGGKFYDERGAQPVPPDDQIMSDLVEQVGEIRHLPWDEAVRSGMVAFLGEDMHKGFIDLCRRQSLVAPPKFDEIRVVFTPLHGVGGMTAGEVLDAQGFRPIPVPEQMTPDGQFPNVTKSPNPEVPESLDRAERVAREQKADLALATDPDADRLGGLAADGQGGFHYITGNEICGLCTWFKLDQLHRQARMPPSPVVITTVVTTGLVTRIARHFGCQVVNNLQVGFKNMAEVLRQFEETGGYEDVRARPEDMILATEESHGIMAMPQIRDKDGAAACLLLAEQALDEKRHGRTLVDRLRLLAEQFGYFRNELINIAMPGIEGKTLIARMMASLRQNPPKEIAGLAVTGVEDLQDPEGRFGPIKGATDAAGRNVLVFTLGESAKVVLRPSGTEPKAKAYIEVASAPRAVGMPQEEWDETIRETDSLGKNMGGQFLRLALATVGR
ncbi:MAG: phospho-sugar mutase [Gemmataceae bacterium]|nr:phospho-sugar mutase [Gemmataceae bacterium]